MPATSVQPVRVWDLPTRLCHWVLAVAIVVSIVSGHVGGNALAWHLRSGYLIFSLLIFRIVWGFVGGRWSRFASFAYTPGALLRYLRGQNRADEYANVGHNPLGSCSVFALLALLVAQVATGLVADDEIATTGPLNRYVSSGTARVATGWHTGWGQWLLIALIVLHVAAIAYYLLQRRRNLVRPMLSGDKLLPPSTPAAVDNAASRLLALLLGALSAGAVVWVATLGQ